MTDTSDALLARVTGAIIAHTTHPGQQQHPVDTAEKIIRMVTSHYGLPTPLSFGASGTTGHVLAQEVAAQRAAADEIKRNTPPLTGLTPVEAGKSYVITGGFTVPVTPADETEPVLPGDIGPND